MSGRVSTHITKPASFALVVGGRDEPMGDLIEGSGLTVWLRGEDRRWRLQQEGASR